MSKKNKHARQRARAEPIQGRCAKNGGSIAFMSSSKWDTLECIGYTSLAHNPEIVAAVDTIAQLVSSMTIHLMENTDAGDVRIVDELSRKIDINPNQYMTRTGFIYWIVRNMMLEGNGNVVVWPDTRRGIIRDLVPIPPNMTSYMPDGWGYKVVINGKEYNPNDVLHFVLNPDSNYPWKGKGYQVVLSSVASNLKQAAKTANGFMSSKWKPSIIVKVDGLIEEFSNPEGRKKLLESYAASGEAGEPWLIPSDQFSVEQVKPLTLADLALSDMVTLDKRTVASIIGVPPFVLGVGDFQRDEWNNFVSTKIMRIARTLEQEFTKKLLISPKRFFRMNSRSLYNYDLKDMAAIADDQYVRGIMDGDEVRDWLGMSPRGLKDLLILENYIPRGMIGDQKKLIQDGGDNSGT